MQNYFSTSPPISLRNCLNEKHLIFLNKIKLAQKLTTYVNIQYKLHMYKYIHTHIVINAYIRLHICLHMHIYIYIFFFYFILATTQSNCIHNLQHWHANLTQHRHLSSAIAYFWGRNVVNFQRRSSATHTFVMRRCLIGKLSTRNQNISAARGAARALRIKIKCLCLYVCVRVNLHFAKSVLITFGVCDAFPCNRKG